MPRKDLGNILIEDIIITACEENEIKIHPQERSQIGKILAEKESIGRLLRQKTLA